jgi:hypothetical protein
MVDEGSGGSIGPVSLIALILVRGISGEPNEHAQRGIDTATPERISIPAVVYMI